MYPVSQRTPVSLMYWPMIKTPNNQSFAEIDSKNAILTKYRYNVGLMLMFVKAIYGRAGLQAVRQGRRWRGRQLS